LWATMLREGAPSRGRRKIRMLEPDAFTPVSSAEKS